MILFLLYFYYLTFQGIELDGSHPLYLFGYGGFNISVTPSFNVSRIVFMRHLGGIIAIPNLRGGG